jgi:hypothetical protein
VLVASVAFLLAGCGMHPGAAAVVGGTTITDRDVDDAAAALCSANLTGAESRGEARPELASRGARQAALQLLVDNELSRQLGEKEGVDPSQAEVSAALAQNRPTIDLLPEERKGAFTDILRGYAEGQLVLLELGRRSLGEQAPDEEAITEGARLRDRFARSVDVEVDPRFGDYDQGTLTAGGGSLSIPVSENAFAGANPEPGAEWVAALPGTQKCA